MSKHTQGPWKAGRRDAYEINVTAPSRFIADIYNATVKVVNGYPSAEEADANASLIAAAPELLEALEQTQIFLEMLGLRSSDEYQANAAAIAKAKGEQ